jgi:DNA helicase-2/ATP-dependent DNA helicase PcrA
MKVQEQKLHYEKQFNAELARLNAEQRRAVEHIEGPVMVIAGPGTGKTQIIAARIGHILKSDLQVAPHNILCLTYTDAGTVAMRSRLLQFIGPTAYRVNIYTFHAFCNDIIQHNLDYFGKKEMEPISDLENVQLLREMLDGLPSTHALKRLKGELYYDVPRLNDLFRQMKEEDWSPEFVSEQIDKYLADLPLREEYVYKKANAKKGIKVGDVKQNDVNDQKDKMELLRAAASLFPKFCSMMRERGRYDYSDMILWVLNAFKRDEDFLCKYQEWYQYFLIDEFQDTSGAQNELLQMLISYWENPNVFVVGDDDQCIYEFQGARVKNMTTFFERYEKEIEIVVLKENYRSTQKILDAAKAVIDNNEQRLINQAPLLKKIPNLTKTLVASGALAVIPPSKGVAQPGDVAAPKLVEYYNSTHEVADIVQSICRLQTEDCGLNEVAIIYAKHRQAENIIELLEKKGIPYSVKKKINILELPLIQQALNILGYLQEETRKPHIGEYLLFEMMHYRFFGISPRDAAKISAHIGHNRLRWREFLSQYEELKKLNLENYGSVIFFEENLTRWTTEAANVTLQMLFERILNWSGMLKQVLDDPDKIFLLQVITTFFDFIKNECSKRPLLKIKDFLEMIAQMRETNIALSINKTIYEENGVNLITAHSAKGLEFRHVFIIGCTTDFWEKARGMSNKFSLPDTLTFTQKDDENKLESTRRLFYVGMTRAKEHLQISFADKNNEGKSLEHSQYIEEIVSKTGIAIEAKHLSADTITEYSALALSETAVNSPLEGGVTRFGVTGDVAVLSLEDNYIKKLLEKFEMTATHLNKYLQCPLVFYYESILRVPSARNEYTAFGTATHNSLKWLFDEMKKNGREFPPLNAFMEEFKKQLGKQRDAFNETEFKNRLAYGEQTLPDYYKKYINNWNKNVMTEFTINNIEIDGVPCNGNLDKIEFLSPNEVNVIDYKTGKPENGIKKANPPSEKEPNGGDYWRQIVFYKMLLDNFKRENWNMISGEIDFLEKESSRTKDFVKAKIPFSKEDISIVKKQVKETYAKIMSHEFTQGCGDKDCRWCDFVKENK